MLYVCGGIGRHSYNYIAKYVSNYVAFLISGY